MANPITHHELITLLRQPRSAVAQLAFAAALALLVFAVWPDTATVNLGGRQAQQLLSVFVYGLLVGLMLLAPAFPAMAIVRERQQGTLRLLLTSPLTPAAILFGKIAGALGFIFILLALSLPAAAACFAMGGISFEQLLAAYGVLALAALQYALVALYVSATVKTTDGALRVTYGLILLLAVIVLGPYYMLQGKVEAPLLDIVQWLSSLSPLPSIMSILGHQEVATRGLQSTINPVHQYLVLASLSVVACAIGTLAKLQPHAMDKPHDKGLITDEQTEGVRQYRRVMFLWFFDPRRRTDSIGFNLTWTLATLALAGAFIYAAYSFGKSDLKIVAGLCAVGGVGFLLAMVNHVISASVVASKEFRTRTFGRAHWMVRLIAGCLIVSMLLMLFATTGTMSISVGYMAGVMVIFQMSLIILVTPALSAAIISSELEGGGWVLLKMTPLSAGNIILGKLLSVAWTLLLILIATLPGYGILLWIDEGQIEHVRHAMLGLTLTAVFALLLGAACSAVIGRTAAATTTAYLLLVSLCVVTLLPWLGEGSLFGRDLVEKFLRVNPLAATLSAIRMPGMDTYDLLPFNWYFLGAASLVCGGVLWFRTWQLTRPQ
jgi:ABC-type transport system involved in multi-copper enzyme maturation permease subunit